MKNVQKIAEEKPVLLFSMMEEKNHKEAVKVLCKEVSWDSIVLTRIPDSRGIDPLKLQDEFMANDRETVVIEDCKGIQEGQPDGILCGFPVFDWRIGKDSRRK